MRPPSIVLFERLYLLKIVIGVIVGIWTLTSLGLLLVPAGAPPAIRDKVMPMMAGSVVVQLLVSVALLFFIARRGSEIAKWIFIVLFGIGAVGTLRSFIGPVHPIELPIVLRAIGLAELVVEAVMVWALFRPDAARWFEARGRAS